MASASKRAARSAGVSVLTSTIDSPELEEAPALGVFGVLAGASRSAVIATQPNPERRRATPEPPRIWGPHMTGANWAVNKRLLLEWFRGQVDCVNTA